jgi:D-serine deaminase-like pyridoxal phosphate-dependent protein
MKADPDPDSDPDREYGRLARALAGERLPAAFVDLDRLDANAAALEARAGTLPIRLVTKSIRCTAIARRLLARGPRWRGLMCYAPAEAAWLASLGFEDLLVAYPSVEPAGLRAVAAQVRAGRTIASMVDCEAHVRRLAAIARDEGVVLPVAIDLDMSSDFPGLRFGVFRSPVDGPAAALALAAAIAREPALRLDGLMGYESQVAGLMDEVPGRAVRSAVVRWLKRRSVAEVNARRRATVEALRAAGHALRFVNGGGTGSFEATRADASVTELAAGSGLYAPTLFDHYAAFRAQPAAGFALAVTRTPRAGIVTCAGGGYPASGPAGRDRLPRPWLPAGCALLGNEGAGEVQTPVRLAPGTALAIGDPLLFRHAKAGELCERFETLLLVQGDRVVDRVPTYRGEGRSFF